MESEKKIYIRGNKQFSDLIDNYFKKLGVKKLIDDDYKSANNLYYVSHDNLVACCNETREIAYIIKDNYKEITVDELIKLFEANKKVKVTLHPFDKVLARDTKTDKWTLNFFQERNAACFELITEYCNYCIPYNKDTAHLLGTSDTCPINYEIEVSKEFKED